MDRHVVFCAKAKSWEQDIQHDIACHPLISEVEIETGFAAWLSVNREIVDPSTAHWRYACDMQPAAS